MLKVIGHRPFQAVVIAALAAVITACAVFAPLYDRALQQALVSIKLDQVTPQASGLEISSGAAGGAPYQSGTDRPLELDVLMSLFPPSLLRAYEKPVPSTTAQVIRQPGRTTDPTGDLTWRSGECGHLTLLGGRCPAEPGQILVSRKDSRNFGLGTGSTVTVGTAAQDLTNTPAGSTKLSVVGVYAQPSHDRFWFGQRLTGKPDTLGQGPGAQRQHDVWLTDQETFAETIVPRLPGLSTAIDLPIDRATAHVDQVLRLGPAIVRFTRFAQRNGGGTTIRVYSGLPALADDVRAQRAQSRIIVPLLMVQLGLLAGVMLWLVLAAATEQRRPEIALSLLRGRGTSGARRLLLAELVPLVLAGVPVGVLLALLMSWFARHAFLPGAAPFELGAGFGVALLAAVVLLLAIVLLAVRQVARESVDMLLRRVPARGSGWGLGVLEAVVVAMCGGIVIAFVTGGLTGPIALTGPALLAVAVGLLLAHVTTPVAARGGRRLLARGAVRAGISVLDAARTPATRRTVAIVTVATALLVFSTDALVVGFRNRSSAAEQEAGASQVAEVFGNDLTGVRTALSRVDPKGTSVTPIVKVHPPGTGAGSVLAVVPEQFTRIALLPDDVRTGTPWRRLAAPTAAPIRLTGTTVSVRVSASHVSADASGRDQQVTLGLGLVDDQGESQQIRLGVLRPGPNPPVTMSAGVHCEGGCLLSGVTLDTSAAAALSAAVNLSDLRTSTGERVSIGPASRWHGAGTGPGSAEPLSLQQNRLTMQVSSARSGHLALQQAWFPATVPSVVANGSAGGSTGDARTVTGLDGQDRAARPVARVSRLPASPPGTTLVNLDAVQRGSSVDSNDVIQVWFAHQDKAELRRVEAALRQQGVKVADVTTLSSHRRTYDESTAAWSLALGVVVGLAGLLIAALVMLVIGVTTWRLRSRDLAALRMSGMSRGMVRSVAAVEQLPAIVLAVLAGSVCGVVGAHFALPTVPLFATAPVVSTLDLGTAWPAVLLVTGLALLVLGVLGWLTGRAIAERATLDRVRDTQ